jgi:hypothetical protein
MTARSLTLPTWRRLLVGIAGAAVVSAIFFPVYIAGATTTGLFDRRFHLYANWELVMPFWPPMVMAYLSMYVLFVLPPFQLDERELIVLVKRLVMGSLIGGAVFLCLPSEIGFVERTDASVWQPLFDAIYAVDSRANAVPSFHVIYTASILLAFMDVATTRLRIVYLTWLLVVCASTLLTHRHHLLDVAGGLAIALAVRAFIRTQPRATVSAMKAYPLTGAAP